MEPSYRGVTVDSRFTPLSSILQHVEGSRWTTNYYSQVLGRDSELSAQQLDRSPAYQQYQLIEGLEILVSSPLTSTQNEESKSMEVTGSATMYPGVIPNKGDTFLADIGDGRQGIFIVTTAEKKSHLKEAYYTIEYTLKSYAENDSVYLTDLANKTIKTYKFVREFTTFGQSPKVLSEDYNKLLDFNKLYKSLLAVYMAEFFSFEEQTLLVPDQLQVTYDPFLTQSLVDWVATEEHPYIGKIKLPNVKGDRVMIQPTIWDCIRQMDDDLLPVITQRVGLADKTQWRNWPAYSGVYFTKIDKVVYPRIERTDVDADHDNQCLDPAANDLNAGQNRFSGMSRLFSTTTLDGFELPTPGTDALPDILPVTHDDYYVFTEGFYRRQPVPATNLERLVLAAIKGEAINREDLLRIAKKAMTWPNLERFYYVPVVLAVLKVATRTND